MLDEYGSADEQIKGGDVWLGDWVEAVDRLRIVVVNRHRVIDLPFSSVYRRSREFADNFGCSSGRGDADNRHPSRPFIERGNHEQPAGDNCVGVSAVRHGGRLRARHCSRVAP
jgi:hypothetical protein